MGEGTGMRNEINQHLIAELVQLRQQLKADGNSNWHRIVAGAIEELDRLYKLQPRRLEKLEQRLLAVETTLRAIRHRVQDLEATGFDGTEEYDPPEYST